MVLLAAPALGLAPFGRSDASPTAMAEAIRALVGDANITTGKVKLELPPIVENGNTVSLTVSVDSPMTEAEHVISIHLVNEKNPQPYIAAFHLAPGPAALRCRPAYALPTRKKWSRSPGSATAVCGPTAPMSL